MRMMSIASGSSGNCIYIGSDNTHILIDAGISRKRIVDGLVKAGISTNDLSGVFVTHEHSDHIKGLGVLTRKDGVPVYSTKGTCQGIVSSSSLGEIPEELLHTMNRDSEIQIGDLTIHSFKVSHDANEPCAYWVSDGKTKAAVCTDLGFYDDYTVENLKNCGCMLIEANHDVNLLQVGGYPYYLKQRILGRQGHLSNENGGRLVDRVLNDSVKTVFLGHLSKENNYDRLAFETVKQEIDMSDSKYKSNDFDIRIASRGEESEIITF